MAGNRGVGGSEPLTPMRRLWLRYIKARGGRIGLTMISLFMFAAFLAPFLAHRLPFYWRDAETGAVAYPLLREFLAPSDTTEPLLERGLNFLFLFIPLALVAWGLMNRFLPALAQMESRRVSLVLGALLSLALWWGLGGMVREGGGGDWLYRETRPLPEADDVLDPGAMRNPAPADRKIARDAFEAHREGRPAPGNAAAREREEAERIAIAEMLRDLIQGPPLAAPSALPDLDSRGITGQNIGFGLNGARWNRLVVEYACPGLLKPFLEFRTAFLILVAATLLALFGMTFIFMTAASQFSASPRWLVILALAAVMALPFRMGARNDYTPYRQLAAEGLGTGVFPPLPYGPNEQGFGPLLPPGWATAPPELGDSDIVDREKLAWDLNHPDPGNPAALHIGHLYSELAQARREDEEGGSTTPAPDWMLAHLNEMIGAARLYTPETLGSIKRDTYVLPYIQAVGANRELSALDLRRFNRLLVERAFPNAIRPAPANHWKKPQHLRGEHFLGTDESGRDVLTRLIHGARVSLSVGFVSVALATVIGLVMGSLAAYYAGWVDILISRFMELMMCFPAFFLILAVIAVLDRRSILNIMLIIGLTSWTGIARLIRGEMLKHKKMDYVSASIALGAPDSRTIFRHILPNAMAPVLVAISFGITGAILTEASLSFIGFGVTPPTPTWGQLLSETRESPLANWWLATFPGLVLFLGVLSYNMVGEALRDALDPRTTL